MCIYIYIRIIFYFDVRPSCRGYRVAICVPWSRNMVQYMGYGQPKMGTLMFPHSQNVIPDSRRDDPYPNMGTYTIQLLMHIMV